MDVALSQPISVWDGLILLCMLLVSRFGLLVQTYGDVPSRQWVCSVVGFFLASLVLDYDVGDFVLVIFVTIALICLVGPRFCHYVALVTMFGYLSYYRLKQGERMDIIANYLLATTTLNLTGIAFEINKAYKMTLKGTYAPKQPNMKKPLEDNLLKLNFVHILHYIFSYTNILTGPYVRYQVYADFIQLPYAVIYNRPSLSQDSTIQMLPFLVLPYCLLQNLWPTSYALTSDFTMRSLLYKLAFSGILFFKFRLLSYIYSCVTLQNNMFAGIGVYVKDCKSVPSHGPTEYPSNVTEVLRRRYINVPTDLEMEMETIKVTKPFECEICPSVSESVMYWNRGLLYWMNEYIYNSLFQDVNNSIIRFTLTCLICVLWHGIHPGLLILSAVTIYYCHVESIFMELYQIIDKSMRNGIETGLWFSKHIIFSWCLMPYFLPSLSQILLYYRTTYFLPILFLVAMHFFGSHLLLMMRNEKSYKNIKDVISDSETYVTFSH